MGNLRIRLLPVGQSDCILIRFPDDGWAVVDCGSKNAASSMALEFLHSQEPRDTPVHFVLATHPDADHAGGVAELLSFSKRDIKAFYHCGVERKMEQGRGSRFLSLPRRAIELREQGRIGDVRALAVGDQLSLDPPIDGLSLAVLNPTPEFVGSRVVKQGASNDISVVVQITYGNSAVLLAGDIEQTAWLRVVARPEFRPPHVLKVSHHGALNGVPPNEVLEPLNAARWGLFSTGSSVKDKPHLTVLESFWGSPSWTTRCTGWSPHCTEADKEYYPARANQLQYPESLRQSLRFSGRSKLYEEEETRFGCCLDNELTIEADGSIHHSVGSKSCNTRGR